MHTVWAIFIIFHGKITKTLVMVTEAINIVFTHINEVQFTQRGRRSAGSPRFSSSSRYWQEKPSTHVYLLLQGLLQHTWHTWPGNYSLHELDQACRSKEMHTCHTSGLRTKDGGSDLVLGAERKTWNGSLASLKNRGTQTWITDPNAVLLVWSLAGH